MIDGFFILVIENLIVNPDLCLTNIKDCNA